MQPSPIDWMLMPLRRYFQLNGRARRAEYWWFYLLVVVVVQGAIGGAAVFGLVRVAPVGLLLLAVLGPPLIAVAVRRLHDTGRSGWWIPLPPVLIAGCVVATAAAMTYGMPTTPLSMLALLLAVTGGIATVFVLVWLCTPGTDGPNRFGEDPFAERDRP